MTPRRIILILASLNVGLLATIASMFFLLKEPPAQTHFSQRVRSVTNTVSQVAVRKINATNLLAVLSGLQQQFNWRSLESSNYVEYIEKLRAVNCPEETIRDIIITDVARLYGERRAAVRAQVAPLKFWETADQVQARTGPGSPYQQQMAALDREERELIRDLLDLDLDTQLARYTGAGEIGLEEAILDPAKAVKVKAVQARYRQIEEQLLNKNRGAILANDESRLWELERQREAELAGILNPEELEDYQLRHSETADSMRNQLVGFKPSEEEFRNIFRLQRTFEEEMKQAFAGVEDERLSEIRAQAMADGQEALDAELKSVLGDKRFAEYQRAQDNDYRNLLQIADQIQAGPELAGRVYDWKVTAQRQREQVLNNPMLNYEQQRAALTAIAAATANTVASAMGADNFKSYRGSYGLWLDDLFQTPPPPPEPERISPPLPPGIYLPFPQMPLPNVNNPIRQ